MLVAYLNVNKFCGSLPDKDKSWRHKHKQELVKRSKDITDSIFERLYSPDILFLSEFAFDDAGNAVLNYLAGKNYYPVLANHDDGRNYERDSIVIGFAKQEIISEKSPDDGRNYERDSIVIGFAKQEIISEKSPDDWLKWNELHIGGCRIIGVHVPDWKYRPTDAEEFWKHLIAHSKEHRNEKVLYIGDFNVFIEGTEGKKHFKAFLSGGNLCDCWLESQHTNNNFKDYTFIGKTRIDYTIASMPLLVQLKEMNNYQDFYKNGLSDHSLITVEFN